MTQAHPAAAPGRAPAEEVDRARFPYRMKDLCELTGLDRQTVHFYIQQGLVPEGHKTGRNMAYYGPEHLERVRLVRRLQHERFLPLKAIRALLQGQTESFSPEQRALVLEVRQALLAKTGTEVPRTLEVEPLLERHGVSEADLAALVDLGLLAVAHQEGTRRVLADDEWLLELWGAFRRSGLTEALGFSARDLLLYDDAVTRLFQAETELVTRRLGHLPAAEVARIVERALPLIGTLLLRLHQSKVRQFFAALG